MKHVSIVIPCKDEEETLPAVLDDLYATIKQLDGYQFEVIVVDDHCVDKTAEIARSYGATVVENTKSAGKGMALRAGFDATQGELIVMLDADYSHRPEELPIFLDALEGDESIGLVVGSRVAGGSEEYNHVRALGNVFLSTMMGLCTRRYLSDALNGFKAFRRNVYTHFKYTSKAFEIEIELIANALRRGYRVTEIVSHERARAGGHMKSHVVRHGTRFLMRILWEGIRGVKPQPHPTADVETSTRTAQVVQTAQAVKTND